MAHEILSREELPKPGFVVAIDAEFVQMQQVGLLTTSLLMLVADAFIP